MRSRVAALLGIACIACVAAAWLVAEYGRGVLRAEARPPERTRGLDDATAPEPELAAQRALDPPSSDDARVAGVLEVVVTGEASEAPLKVRLRRPLDELPPPAPPVAAALTEEQRHALGLEPWPEDVEGKEGTVRTEAELVAELVRNRARVAQERERGALVAEVELARDGATRIEGLAPGRLVVTLERGDPWEVPEVVAATEVVIVEVGVARATLAIEPVIRATRGVVLAGSVRCSPAWGRVPLELTFERIEPIERPADGVSVAGEITLTAADFTAVAGETGRYQFDLGLVAPGRWAVQSVACAFVQRIDLGSDGNDAVAIVIGDPADVVVRAVDDVTSAPLEARRLLCWRCARGDDAGPFRPAACDEAAGAATIRAPAGAIELALAPEAAEEFEPPAHRTLVVAPGRNDLTLRLRRVTALVLTATIDGVASDWPSGVARGVRLESLDGSQPDRAPAYISDQSLTFRAAPGRWRVAPPELAGFEPTAPLDLMLEPGVVTRRSLELRRRR